jgi:hypothetical protein
MQDIGEALQKAMDYCPVPFVFFCPAHPFSSKDRSEGCSGNRRASGGTAALCALRSPWFGRERPLSRKRFGQLRRLGFDQRRRLIVER